MSLACRSTLPTSYARQKRLAVRHTSHTPCFRATLASSAQICTLHRCAMSSLLGRTGAGLLPRAQWTPQPRREATGKPAGVLPRARRGGGQRSGAPAATTQETPHAPWPPPAHLSLAFRPRRHCTCPAALSTLREWCCAFAYR